MDAIKAMSAGTRASTAPLAGTALLMALVVAGCQVQNMGSWDTFLTATGGTVYTLAQDPHVPQLLYAGTSNGKVYRVRTDSHGADAGTGIPDDATVAALAVDPTHAGVVFAGTTVGVYASSDYGDTWQARSHGLPADDGVDALALGSFPAGLALFAGTEAHGVYISLDAGATWQASGNGLPPGVAVFGLLDDAPGRTLYAALAARGVYASADGGQTWVARDSGLPVNTDTFTLLALPVGGGAAGRTLFAGTGAGVFASTDGGKNWQAAGLSQTRALALAADPTAPTTLYAGTSDNAYRSADGGKNWTIVAPGIHQAVNAILVVADQSHHPIVIAGTSQLLRYPALPGSTGGIGTIVSVVIFLVLLVVLFYFTRRSRRMLDRTLASGAPPAGTRRSDGAADPRGNGAHPSSGSEGQSDDPGNQRRS
jgi:photosystem II stability/assembly factor-like uncharacterized protein